MKEKEPLELASSLSVSLSFISLPSSSSFLSFYFSFLRQSYTNHATSSSTCSLCFWSSKVFNQTPSFPGGEDNVTRGLSQFYRKNKIQTYWLIFFLLRRQQSLWHRLPSFFWLHPKTGFNITSIPQVLKSLCFLHLTDSLSRKHPTWNRKYNSFPFIFGFIVHTFRHFIHYEDNNEILFFPSSLSSHFVDSCCICLNNLLPFKVTRTRRQWQQQREQCQHSISWSSSRIKQ